MLAVPEHAATRDNDRKFVAPVTPLGLRPFSVACPADAVPRTARRVIFPSLHASSSRACGKQEMAESLPLSPQSEGATRRLAKPSIRRAAIPELSPSERDVLLARLSSVLLLPPIGCGAASSLANDRRAVPQPADAARSPTPRPPAVRMAPPVCAAAPSASILDLPALTAPSLGKGEAPDEPLFSLKRMIMPSWELQHSGSWGARPRGEAEQLDNESSSRSSQSGEPLPSILRKSSSLASSSPPPSPRSLKEEMVVRRCSRRALPLASPSSEASDLPSLASSQSSDSIDDELDGTDNNRGGGGRGVSFSPRVFVRLFVRTKREQDHIWYSAEELEKFKLEALERIQSYHSSVRPDAGGVLPTGTGRVVRVPPAPPARLLFSHQALQDDAAAESPAEAVAREEVRRILVVDPREVCRTLFAAAFRLLQPNAVIRTAADSSEALAWLAREPDFDVVLVEEHLDRPGANKKDLLGSGSTLLSGIAGEAASSRRPEPKRVPLLIGVTAQLGQDKERLERNGADVVWSKPPPTMSDDLQRELLRLLLAKRGKTQQAESLL